MPGRLILLAAYLLFLTHSSVGAQSPAPPAPAPQTNPAAAPCTENCPPVTAKPAAVPEATLKPPAKPHRVITNEDIDARPRDYSIEGSREIIQQLSECDRACFDQVAQRAGVNGYSSPRWKLALLEAIDAVKADSAWRGYLGEILGVQDQTCELQARKTADLQRFSDPRTVTPNELAIDREYEPKFREIRGRLNTALDRANAYINKNAPSPFQAQFMHLQVEKLVNANCTITVPALPEDTDDPADPQPFSR